MKIVSTIQSLEASFILCVQAYNTSDFLFAGGSIIGQTPSNSRFCVFLVTEKVTGVFSGTVNDPGSSGTQIIPGFRSRTEVVTTAIHLKIYHVRIL